MKLRFGSIALYILGASLVFAAVAMHDDSVIAPVLACFGLLLTSWAALLADGDSDG